MKRATPSAFLRVWGWPIAIGLTTAIGLIAALLGDGTWDWISAAALAAPAAVAAWFGWIARGSSRWKRRRCN